MLAKWKVRMGKYLPGIRFVSAAGIASHRSEGHDLQVFAFSAAPYLLSSISKTCVGAWRSNGWMIAEIVAWWAQRFIILLKCVADIRWRTCRAVNKRGFGYGNRMPQMVCCGFRSGKFFLQQRYSRLNLRSIQQIIYSVSISTLCMKHLQSSSFAGCAIKFTGLIPTEFRIKRHSFLRSILLYPFCAQNRVRGVALVGSIGSNKAEHYYRSFLPESTLLHRRRNYKLLAVNFTASWFWNIGLLNVSAINYYFTRPFKPIHSSNRCASWILPAYYEPSIFSSLQAWPVNIHSILILQEFTALSLYYD